MTEKPIIVVMAAGMGSRYGGLKQIDPVGCQGEAILDYSLYDAYAAGFRKAVIIIKEAIREDFMATVGKRLERCPMEIHYAYQELYKIPEGFTIPEGRTKPWGTSHAVLCAAELIGDAPFAVVNSDDYYGKSAYEVLYHALEQPAGDTDFCMVGYLLGNTVTDSGSVARGVCSVDSRGFLTQIDERTRIEKYPGGIHYTEDGENWTDLPGDCAVSMNMWGYRKGFLKEIREEFPRFLEKTIRENPLKGEFYLPVTVKQMIAENRATVEVLHSPDRWYGVTYAADKPEVIRAIREMTDAGKYPDGLWG